MVYLMLQMPLKEFQQLNPKRSVMEKTNFFRMVCFEPKEVLIHKIYSDLVWYTLFLNTPIVVAVMSDNYYWEHISDESIKQSQMICRRPKEMPNSFSDEARKLMLPKEQRIIQDEGKIKEIIREIRKNKFRDNPCIEIQV